MMLQLRTPAGPGGACPAGLAGLAGPARIVGPARLGRIVRGIAARPSRWRPVVQFDADRRWYYRLGPGPDDQAAAYEVWLLTWLPGQQTGFHDHGEAVGAFAVASGSLRETTATVGDRAVSSRVLSAGAVRAFGPAYLHDVASASAGPAVSVHAYSPPLSAMRRYEMTPGGLILTGTETAGDGW
jgi:hypothetical protein